MLCNQNKLRATCSNKILLPDLYNHKDGKAEANQNRLGHKPILYFDNNVLNEWKSI